MAGLGRKTVSRLSQHLTLTSEPFRTRSDQDLVDLNRAALEELVQLPGIGPELARRIIEYRHRGIGFQEPDDLLVVPGIGPGTVEKIRSRVRFR